jgi:hypothetical protein
MNLGDTGTVEPYLFIFHIAAFQCMISKKMLGGCVLQWV